MTSSDFIPDDSVCSFFTLDRLLDAIKAKYGEDYDPSQIGIHVQEKQYQCFGYDQYDSNDWRIEFEFEKL